MLDESWRFSSLEVGNEPLRLVMAPGGTSGPDAMTADDNEVSGWHVWLRMRNRPSSDSVVSNGEAQQVDPVSEPTYLLMQALSQCLEASPSMPSYAI